MSTRDLLRANEARFYALAAGFSAEEWSQPSLCDGWYNHDVLAHLVVGCSAGAAAVTAEMLRHSGSFDRANAALACSLAATRSPAELLDDFAVDQVGPVTILRNAPSPAATSSIAFAEYVIEHYLAATHV